MRLIVFTQGGYGERVHDNLRRRAPEEWTIEHEALPEALPPIIEEPEKHVSGLELGGEWDLVLFLGESPSAFSLLPAIMRRLSAGAVVAPVDDYSWLPLGLERQIRSSWMAWASKRSSPGRSAPSNLWAFNLWMSSPRSSAPPG